MRIPMPRGIKAASLAAAIFTFLSLAGIVLFIIIKGAAHITPQLFSLYCDRGVSIIPALINTLTMTLCSLAAAVPLGVCTAVYLCEYSARGSRTVRVIRAAAQTMAGIPSVIYGLFGMLCFVTSLGWGYSLLSGCLTMALMVLPIIMQTAEQSLQAVPDGLREASLGLGAGRLRTTLKIVLPAAMPGIVSGVTLAAGRIMGETAALIYTAGTASDIAGSMLEPGRTLSVHMYILAGEALYTDDAYAAALVLIVLVIGFNGICAAAARKITKAPK